MEFLLAEDRRTLRHAVTVTCHVVRERGFVLLGERGLDLSATGMLLASCCHAVPGEPVFIALEVPGTSRWIDTLGTVARVVRGRRPGDPGPCIGLNFGPLSSEDNRLVRWALRRKAPPLPARPTRIDYAATAALIAFSFHY
jgi:hypothetical protein